MFAAMVACKQFPNGYLPVLANSLEELCAEMHAMQSGVRDLINIRLEEMGTAKDPRTGKTAALLGLNTGVRAEMERLANPVTPIVMADKIIAAKDLLYPDLLSELHTSATGQSICFDVFRDTKVSSPVRGRLAERLGKKVAVRAPRLIYLGRMLAHFVLTGEQLRHFID
jgi:hypothetical protein